MSKSEYAAEYKEIANAIKDGAYSQKAFYQTITEDESIKYNTLIDQKNFLLKRFVSQFNVKGSGGYNGRSREEVAEYNIRKLARNL